MIKLFELLTTVRKSRRVSVSELSESLDISRSSIYRYENKEFKTYDITQMCRIAIYLHVPLEQVLDALKHEYHKDYLNNVAEIYKEEHIKKYGYYDELDGKRYEYNTVHPEALKAASEYVMETLNDVNLRYYEGLIDIEHLELIDFITRNLSRSDAKKAIHVMRAVFNE